MANSFKILRRRLANEIEPGSFAVCTTTSAGTTTTLVSTDLALTRGDTDALDAGWAYWTSGSLLGHQRPVQTNGLDTATGTVTTTPAWSASAPNTAEFEWHGRYPVKCGPGTPWVSGYLEMLNYSLPLVWFEDDISVSAVTSQTRYLLDITTHPWLADEPKRRVLDIMAPLASDNVKRASGHRWRIDDDAEAPALVFESGGYNTGETFYLRCARPAHTRIKISGTWTDVTAAALNSSQFGLAADSDECHGPPQVILALAITQAMNALGMRQPDYQSDTWEARRQYWATVAAASKYTRLPRRNDGNQRLRAVGVTGGLMGVR